MSKTWFSRHRIFLLGIVPIIACAPIASSQGTAPAAVSAGSVSGLLFAVFSDSQTVQRVLLSGNATRNMGSPEDSGPVSLTASANSSSQLQLAFSTIDPRLESRAFAGSSTSCRWAGCEVVEHGANSRDSWRPKLWFLSTLSLQPLPFPGCQKVADLGQGIVDASANACQHLQTNSTLAAIKAPIPHR
jgi:hypothetical protein